MPTPVSRRPARALALAVLAGALLAGLAAAGPLQVPDGFEDRLVVGGLTQPTAFDFLPGGRVLVLERYTSRVRLVVNGAYATTDPALAVDSVESANGEHGLLGIAVDPRWPASPYVYLQYSHRGGTNRIARFTASGDLAGSGDGVVTLDPASRHDVLRVTDLYGIHNGGTLRFGPDSLLYSSQGDDGDPCAGQNIAVPFGKILRLDVRGLPAGPGGPPAPESLAPPGNPFAAHASPWARLVWSYGLRNPFNFHVDPANGDLFIADVGQLDWEEFDWAPHGGINFGWGWYEGPARSTFTCPFDSTGSAPPIFAYDHFDSLGRGEAAISAGLYRAPAGASSPFPASYEGDYFMADVYGGWIKRLKRTGDSWAIAPPEPGQPNADTWAAGFGLTTNFLVGPDGALWYCYYGLGFTPTGELRRIAHDGATSVGGGAIATRAELRPPHPSPSRGAVTLGFALAAAGRARLEVHDLAGRRVATPAPETWRAAGAHEARWDGRDARGRMAPAGVYLAVLRHAHGTVARRFVRLE